TTIWSAVHHVEYETGQARLQPISRLIANTQFYVVDAAGHIAPIGVPGELLIGGDGLARGYFRRPEETKTKFVAHPFSSAPDARVYRTGDLVRYRDDGVLEFLGRMDTQVKVRGFRIELEEIEAVMAQHPAVKRAVAIVRGEPQESSSIVAYVVPREGETCVPA